MDSNVTVETNVSVKPKRVLKRDTKRKIFFACVVAFPLLHFALFYVYVNLEMFLMSFKEYSVATEGLGIVEKWVGFDNFKHVFDVILHPEHYYNVKTQENMIRAIRMMFPQTFAFFAMSMTFLPCGVLFAYYVYKNYPLSGLFRVMLYLPNIVSGIVMTMMFQLIFREIFKMEMGFIHLILYNFIMGFGLNVVMYTSAMCGIDTSIPESCELDGAGALKEFWFVTVPMIFPTIITFLVTSLAGMFGQSAHLFTFYGETAADEGFLTIGYFMYINQIKSDIIETSYHYVCMNYPQLSAMGLMFTVIVVPITLGTRRLLEKYGPSEN